MTTLCVIGPKDVLWWATISTAIWLCCALLGQKMYYDGLQYQQLYDYAVRYWAKRCTMMGYNINSYMTMLCVIGPKDVLWWATISTAIWLCCALLGQKMYYDGLQYQQLYDYTVRYWAKRCTMMNYNINSYMTTLCAIGPKDVLWWTTISTVIWLHCALLGQKMYYDELQYQQLYDYAVR